MLHVVLHVVVVVVVGVPVARLLRKATLGQSHVLALKEDCVLALELTNAIGTLEHLRGEALRWHSDGTQMALRWHSEGTQRALRGHSDGTLMALSRWALGTLEHLLRLLCMQTLELRHVCTVRLEA